jgi:hypothetical protein
LNGKRTNNPSYKWGNELNNQFPEKVQMASKYVKKFSTSLAIKERQTKTTLILPHLSQNGKHHANKQ